MDPFTPDLSTNAPGPPPAGLPPYVIAGLRQARRVVVLTGAGISAESGIPTFRDAQTGYWARFNPMALASPEGFAADPQQVWDWYRHRRALCRAAQPNPGHAAVVALEAFYPEFLLITQNVDGLHRVAGSRRVLEIHGSLRRVRCAADERHPRQDWREGWDVAGAPIPRCACGALLRPDVVWFGEALDERDLARADAAARDCEAFLAIGTSATVQPAALLPLIARQAGALVIEVNAEPTSLSPLTAATILGRAGEVLPQLVDVLRTED
jgi:NAD-dependent protein deacetylase/lipoamidase